MAWLRIDDGFAEHRKLLSLKRADRWTWLEVLCYCARQGNGGHVPDGVVETMRAVTPAFLERCEAVGLLDREPHGYVVHDWPIYNGSTVEERVKAFLVGSPEATANDVYRVIGGNRDAVLKEVARQRSLVPGNRPPGSNSGSIRGSKSVQSPSPYKEPPSSTSTSGPADAAGQVGEGRVSTLEHVLKDVDAA